MPNFVELEIRLQRQAQHAADGMYMVEAHLTRSDSEADIHTVPGSAQFDFPALEQEVMDPLRYGKLLGGMLLADPNLRTRFNQALDISQALEYPMRLRLSVDAGAPELHRLLWETLRHPDTGRWLLTDEHVLFSRFLRSDDLRPVHLRTREDLKALIAIANPSDLEHWAPAGEPLPPVDRRAELERARAALGDLPACDLSSEGRVTLKALAERLRSGYDILYLVCHGALRDGQPYLWLENDAGEVEVVAGEDLVTRLSELQYRPRLVVLASCQSAGVGHETRSADGSALAAVGPRLAQSGIPAVLAMQGRVTVQTAQEFMEVFFTQLQRHGQIDQAASSARSAVAGRPDSWMPVLFMRLKLGRIWWYTPQFRDADQFQKWKALFYSLNEGKCTVILGAGLTERFFGSTREIARRWADVHRYPMAPDSREDLPQVAQYLAVLWGEEPMRGELRKELQREIWRRHGSYLPARLEQEPLEAVIAAAGAVSRARDPDDPHKVLATLPVRTYVTTNPEALLRDALEETLCRPVRILREARGAIESIASGLTVMRGGDPGLDGLVQAAQAAADRVRDVLESAQRQGAAVGSLLQAAGEAADAQQLTFHQITRAASGLSPLLQNAVQQQLDGVSRAFDSLRASLAAAAQEMKTRPQVEICRWKEGPQWRPSPFDDSNYKPGIERPLVCHLFGHLEVPDSSVVTEDDYFDYLLALNSEKQVIDPNVLSQMTDSALLFLGFQMDDWRFRVLLRYIMSQRGAGRLQRYFHVAVQIDPEEGRMCDPETARKFLEDRFQDARISIFWGTVEDFTRELRRRWREEEHGQDLGIRGGTR